MDLYSMDLNCVIWVSQLFNVFSLIILVTNYLKKQVALYTFNVLMHIGGLMAIQIIKMGSTKFLHKSSNFNCVFAISKCLCSERRFLLLNLGHQTGQMWNLWKKTETIRDKFLKNSLKLCMCGFHLLSVTTSTTWREWRKMFVLCNLSLIFAKFFSSFQTIFSD